MSLVSDEIIGFTTKSSWIRKMFETGLELKKKYGADAVCDFSLGNPDLPPPPSVKKALKKIAEDADKPFTFGYMSNAGLPDVREIVAKKVSEEQNIPLTGNNLVLCCGAAGGINALFRAILTPGSEVVCPAPYFVEYGFYAGNYGAKLVAVPAKDFTFELDVPALAAAFTPKTKAVIINSPNNPTGQIYSAKELTELGTAIAQAEKKFGTQICLISDEPYRFLNFDGTDIPSLLQFHKNSVVIGSYSKNLSLAGERLGYIAINPEMPEAKELLTALTMTTRILGFLNAPVIGQKILRECIHSQVDLEIYRERRNALAEVLTQAGFEFNMPRGTFYFFAKSPVPDDGECVNALLNEKILVVPGKGFGYAGYVRLAFCGTDLNVIRRSAEGFKRAAKNLKKG